MLPAFGSVSFGCFWGGVKTITADPGLDGENGF